MCSEPRLWRLGGPSFCGRDPLKRLDKTFRGELSINLLLGCSCFPFYFCFDNRDAVDVECHSYHDVVISALETISYK